MTGDKKKGLSIGAAMKQRMDSREERAATTVQKEARTTSDGTSSEDGEMISMVSSSPTEGDVLESFNTRLPRGLHRRLKVFTAVEGHKIQDVVAQALDEFLSRSEKKES